MDIRRPSFRAAGALRVAIVLGVALSRSAFAIPQFSITDLGALAGGTSYASAINDSGDAVGYSTLDATGRYRAVKFSGGGVIDLGVGDGSQAQGTNSAGDVVGWKMVGVDTRAFRYSGGTGAIAYISLGGASSVAFDVNDSGLAVGWAQLPGNQIAHAFVSSGGGAVQDIGTFGGVVSQLRGINAAGVAVGYATGNGYFPFSYAIPSGHFTDLTPTIGAQSTSPEDVNDAGEVAGVFVPGTTGRRGFVYAGGQFTTISLGGGESYASAINNDGQAVGSARVPSGQLHAFLFDDGEVIDLSILQEVRDAGWTSLQEANDINNHGMIVGAGIKNRQLRAFLLTPVQVAEPTTISLLVLGLAALVSGGRKSRPRSPTAAMVPTQW